MNSQINRIASCKRCVWSDHHPAVGEISGTSRGARRRLSNTLLAKCARYYHFWWSEYLDVETHSHFHQNE